MVRSIVAAVTLALSTTAFAQSHPDFAGTWNLLSSFPTNASPLSRIVLVQDDSAITISNQRYVFYTTQTDGLRPERASRSEWVTSAFVITTKTAGPRSTWEDSDTYSLDTAGNLVVVRLRTSLVPDSMTTTVAVYQRER